jgi:hypothetical protein
LSLPTDNHTGDEYFIDEPPAPVSRSLASDPRFRVVPFPLATAGAPIPGSVRSGSGFAVYGSGLSSNEEYAPFCSKIDWDIARWAKLRGPSSAAVSELLEIDEVSIRQLNFNF